MIITIIGDAIQNLRSALDHFANQLMLVNLGVPESDRESEFPIRNTAGKYEATIRGMEKQGFLRKDAVDPLLRVQAYKGGDGHQLWVLNRLNNVDKHRIILAVGSAFQSVNLGAFSSRLLQESMRTAEAARKAAGEPQWPYSADTIPILDVFFRGADIMCPLKVGDELFIGDPARGGGQMDPEKDFTFDIAFNEPKIMDSKPVLETLQHLADLVSNTILLFRPLLA